MIDMAELDSILGIDERLPFYDTPPSTSVPKPSSSTTKKPKPSTPKKKKVKPRFTPEMRKKLKEDKKAKKEKEQNEKIRMSSKRKSSESTNAASESEIKAPKQKKLRRIQEDIGAEDEASPSGNETIPEAAKPESSVKFTSESSGTSQKEESSKKSEEPNDFWKELLAKEESESSRKAKIEPSIVSPETSPRKKQKGKRRGKSVKQEKLEKERLEKQKKIEEEKLEVAKNLEEEERQKVMAEIKELLPKVQKKPFVPDLTVKYPNKELEKSEERENHSIESVAESKDDTSSNAESKDKAKITEVDAIPDKLTISNNISEETQDSTAIQDQSIPNEGSFSKDKKSKTIEDISITETTEDDNSHKEINLSDSSLCPSMPHLKKDETPFEPETPDEPVFEKPVENISNLDGISTAEENINQKEKSSTTPDPEESIEPPASPEKTSPKKKLTQEEVESLMEKMDSEEEKDKIWRDFLMQDSLDKFAENEITKELDNNTQTPSEENVVSETEEIEQKLANLKTEEEKDQAWKEFLMKDAIEANDGKAKFYENNKNNPKDKNDCVSGEISTNEMDVNQEAIIIDSTSSNPKKTICKNVDKMITCTDAPQRNDPTEIDKQSTTTPTDAALEETDNLPITSLIERMDSNFTTADDNTGIKQTVKKQNAHKVDLKKVDFPSE